MIDSNAAAKARDTVDGGLETARKYSRLVRDYAGAARE